MSTQVAQANDPLQGVSEPRVNEKPRLALTGIIEKIGDAADTSSGNYSGVDIFFKKTRGSTKLFPKMYFRPEMFSFGLFDADRDYLKNDRNLKELAEVNPKNGKTFGETFESTYGMNVMPRVRRDKDKNVIGVQSCTPFMAISGGTLDSLRALIGVFKSELANLPDSAVGSFGYKEFTPEQIVTILNNYLQEKGEVELGVTAKQSKDQSGELTDRYEVDRWQGEFTAELDAQNEKQRAKTAGGPMGKRLVIGYSL